VLDRGNADFRERRQREVRRIPLLGKSVNKGWRLSSPNPSANCTQKLPYHAPSLTSLL
jgi:hypothetical protein